MSLVLFTDGGARGNPGPAGAGYVLYVGEQRVFAEGTYLGDKLTNNQAEYLALFLGLSRAVESGHGGTDLEIRMDSELVVRQMQGVYKVKDAGLKERFLETRKLIAEHFPRARFTHVPRAENAEADKLVNEAIDAHI